MQNILLPKIKCELQDMFRIKLTQELKSPVLPMRKQVLPSRETSAMLNHQVQDY